MPNSGHLARFTIESGGPELTHCFQIIDDWKRSTTGKKRGPLSEQRAELMRLQVLMLGVEPSQFSARVVDRELPVDAALRESAAVGRSRTDKGWMAASCAID